MGLIVYFHHFCLVIPPRACGLVFTGSEFFFYSDSHFLVFFYTSSLHFGRFEMAENPYNASDLNSVLHTLSSLTAPGITSRSASSSQTGTPDPRQARQERVHTPRESTPSTPKSQSKTPAVDPSTITTWPAALRYVMRTVGQNEETQLRIRGLIRSQHNHERQWWKGREALLERQQARGDKKKELDAVL